MEEAVALEAVATHYWDTVVRPALVRFVKDCGGPALVTGGCKPPSTREQQMEYLTAVCE
jgi:hypothetical protein